jgi:hypothetical protein
MTRDADKGGGLGGRLWGGREKNPRETDRPTEEKVLPLKTPAARPTTHDRTYVAFEIREHAERLHIRRSAQPSRFPSYNYLLDISYDHFQHSAFTLIYTFMIVEVTGWNLESVVHAISFGNCERLTEYNSKLYDAPAQGEPLIEKINIVTADEKLMK